MFQLLGLVFVVLMWVRELVMQEPDTPRTSQKELTATWVATCLTFAALIVLMVGFVLSVELEPSGFTLFLLPMVIYLLMSLVTLLFRIDKLQSEIKEPSKLQNTN